MTLRRSQAAFWPSIDFFTMPSFSDSIFLFILALLLFGPKKLPKLARELGKWVGEFRRASNEFKMQMEEELRIAEQADRQKEIAAMEAAAPLPPPLPETSLDSVTGGDGAEDAEQQILRLRAAPSAQDDNSGVSEAEWNAGHATEPLPIAVSGDLKIMPPVTGLPQPRGTENGGALGGLLESIPMRSGEAAERDEAGERAVKESVLHGD